MSTDNASPAVEDSVNTSPAAPDTVSEQVAPENPTPAPASDSVTSTSSPETISTAPAAAPSPAASDAERALVEPAPSTPAPEAPSVPDELGLYALSDDFVYWLEEKVQPFLDLMDIPNVNDRRAALLDLDLGEDGVADLLNLSQDLLAMQIMFAEETENKELSLAADTYLGKVVRLKSWIGL